jgi:uncharacterized membrane protein YccC
MRAAVTVRVVASKMLAELGAFNRGKLGLARGLRGAAAVLAPLVIGAATGHTQYGAYMALGALPAGFASFHGETRSRVAAVALASVGMSLSTFIGAITAATAPWLLVPIVAVWAYFTGLAVSLGTRASIAIFQWPIALLISTALPAAPADAALRAGLVLAGGLLHAVFVAASWTLRPGVRETTTLAASYQALANYALRLATGILDPPAAEAFPAQAVLDDPNPLLEPALRRTYVDLLEEAERLRASLAALGSQPHGRRLAADAAQILHRVAETLLARRAEWGALISTLGEEIARLTVAANADCSWPGEALARQLRAVGRILAELIEPRAQREDGVARMSRPPAAILSAFATLRANMTIRTEAGRHALRLAVVAAVVEVLVQATGLYQGRWATLTIFIVLKPDYASTVSRGPQRALGTALGAMLGAAAAYLGHAHLGGLIAAAGIFIAAAYGVVDATYFLFSVFITAFIVVLLALMGQPAMPTAEARILQTILGAALALAGYLAWPTWAATTAHEQLARLIEAHRDYVTALLVDLGNPGTADGGMLRRLQTAARQARSDAEAAATRLADEPGHGPMTPQFADLVNTAVSHLAHAELALHALILSPERPLIATRDFSAALASALGRLASGLRTLQPPAISALGVVRAGSRGTPLAAITDGLLDATDTLDSVLRAHLLPTAPATA